MRHTAVVLSVGVCIGQLTLAFRGDLRYFLDQHLIDDVYYYLQWAWNVAHGHGATFDGINATNGVQPLWALLLVAAARLAPSKDALVPLTLGLAAVFNGVSVYGLYLALRRFVSPVGQLVGLALWVHFLSMPRIMQSGMEVSLNAAACTWMLAIVLVAAAQPSGRHLVVAGVLFGVCVLSRIDNLLYVGCAGLLLLVLLWRNRQPFVPGLLRLGLPAVALIAPYFLWNIATFGHLMPISGRVKTWSHRVAEVDALGGYVSPEYLEFVAGRITEVWQRILFLTVPDSLRDALQKPVPGFEWWLLAGLVVLALLVFRAHAVRRDRELAAVMLLGLASFLHIAVIVFLVGQYVVYTTWYFVWQHLLLIVAAAIVLDGVRRMLSGRRRAQHAWVVVLLVCAGLTLFRTVTIVTSYNRSTHWPYNRSNFLQVRRDVALWMRQTLPADAVAASFNAGQLGYDSGLRVINLDGLVNNDTLLEWDRSGKPLTAYLDRMGVEFLVDWERPTDQVRRTFHHVPRECLQLLKTWEVPGPDGPQRVFYAYRYVPPCDTGEAISKSFLGALEDYP